MDFILRKKNGESKLTGVHRLFFVNIESHNEKIFDSEDSTIKPSPKLVEAAENLRIKVKEIKSSLKDPHLLSGILIIGRRDNFPEEKIEGFSFHDDFIEIHSHDFLLNELKKGNF